MKCELCRKNTASFYKFVPALAKQVPVCAVCLSRIEGQKTSLVTDFFNEIFDFQNAGQNLRTWSRTGAVVCTNCGFEFDDYFEKGRFGCVKCYDVFHDRILGIVGEIHGSTRHNGSRPTPQQGRVK